MVSQAAWEIQCSQGEAIFNQPRPFLVVRRNWDETKSYARKKLGDAIGGGIVHHATEHMQATKQLCALQLMVQSCWIVWGCCLLVFFLSSRPCLRSCLLSVYIVCIIIDMCINMLCVCIMHCICTYFLVTQRMSDKTIRRTSYMLTRILLCDGVMSSA